MFEAFIILFILLAFNQGWKFLSDIREFFTNYRVTKPKSIKFKLSGSCLQRTGKTEIWDGFGHTGSNENGLFYYSWGFPCIFIPWQDIKVIGNKKYLFRTYNCIKVSGFPQITWLLPVNVKIQCETKNQI